MVALRIRLAFTPGTRSFVLQAFGGTYFTRGSVASLSSSTRTPIAYALTAARGHYALAGPAIGITYTQPGVVPSAPQQLWPGIVNSALVQMTAWPPADGTNPPAFNFYRTDMPLGPGVPLNPAPRVPNKVDGGANTIPFATWGDTTVVPGTSYSYYATATSSPNTPYTESSPSPQLSVVTLAATGNTPPAPVTSPETYIPPYSLPVGGTLWTATQNSAAANTGNAGAGTGTKFNVGCSAQYAFNNAAAGDVVVLSSGVKYNSNGANAFTIPSTANGFYVVSDQDPGYNPAGTLPPYSYVTSTFHLKLAAAVAPLAGATSLTLTTKFLGRTGWFKTSFDSTNACGIESKQCLYTAGSTSVVWDIGLQANCGTRLLVGYGNQVTPWDAGIPIGPGLVTNPAPSMPILEYTNTNGGQGLQIFGSNIRLVGICIQPAPNHTVSGTTVTSFFTSVLVSGSNNTIDRCVSGRNNLVSTRSYFWRSFQMGCVNGVLHQSYCFGADSGPHGADTQAVFFSGFGPQVVQNTYLEALFEGSISGGQYIALANMPHDLVIRHCWGHKPTCWQQVTTPDPTPNPPNLNPSISFRVKNQLELKCVYRAEWYGNNLQGNGFNYASAGQQGRALPITARDQNSTNSARTLVSLTANGAGVGTAVASFNLPMAVGTFFYTTISNAAVAAFNGNYERCQMVSANTFTFPAAAGLSGGTGPVSGKTLQCTSPPQCGGMWQSITDFNCHDNQIYGVAQAIYVASGVDGCPTVHVERPYFHNNLALCNPTLTDNGAPLAVPVAGPGKCTLVGSDVGGPSANLHWANNTIIACAAGTGNTNATLSSGIRSIQSGVANVLQDRAVITDNIIDATQGVFLTSGGGTTPPHNGSTGGTALQFSFRNSNVVFDKNIFTLDTSSGANAYNAVIPGTTNNPVAYAALGTDTLISNTTIPDSPADWNVVSGTYLTDSTTGGPRGSHFGGPSLAADWFPRLRLQVIAPSGSTYANAGFQTSAGLFNIVDFGPYMHIEQDQGATFATVFAAVRAAGKANGIYTRCVHYTNSWAQALPAWDATIAYTVGMEVLSGGNRYICILAHTNHVPPNATFWTLQGAVSGTGNGATYSVWSNMANAANWWLRTAPYPTGNVVLSTFGGETTNTGVLQCAVGNPALDGSGRTFAQGYWNHYDNVLRLGQSTALGYPSGSVIAPNPYLDGYQMDNIFDQPRVSGAWNNDATQYTSHYGSSADATISTFLQQGQAQMVAALRAINPNLLIMGNTDYFVRSTNVFSYQVALDPSQVRLFDMPYWQVVIGTFGIEGQGTTTTAQLMANLIAAEQQTAPGGSPIFEQNGPSHGASWSNVNQASWTNADWQGARFGMAMACMRGYHYALSRSDGTYTPLTIYRLDEFGPQNGVRAWLGAALDGVQAAARTQGVWYRVFAGGVVFMNPKGNGSKTITLATLGLTGLKAISNIGFGDATINTGSAVTSITLADRDGRFLTF